MFESLSQAWARTLHRTLATPPGRLPDHLYQRGRPLILAHRGARMVLAENTMGAFMLGMEQGADGVELDVHLTRDRKVVVFHDDDLGRVGRKDLLTRNVTYEELRACNLASLVKNGPPQAGRVHAPLLEEVLTTLPAHAVINVELKGNHAAPDGLEVEVLRTVARAGAESRVLYSSFNPLRCMRLRRMAPDAVVGLLHESGSAAHLRDLWWLPLIHPQAVHPESVLCTAEYVQHARSLGLAIHVWTVNDPSEMVRLTQLGVDALITDVADVAVKLLRSDADTPRHEAR